MESDGGKIKMVCDGVYFKKGILTSKQYSLQVFFLY